MCKFDIGIFLIGVVGMWLPPSEAAQNGLWNKQLNVALRCWDCIPKTWFYIKNHTDRNGLTTIDGYGGYFGDMLQFLQDSRNCSFKFLTTKDRQWGKCSGINNCTGMIGMINRKEADFAVPSFVDTDDRRPNVDFSVTTEAEFYTIAIPLIVKPNIWYFASPMTYQVWLCVFFSVPIYFLTMVLADYIYHGNVKWQSLGSFVLRSAISEHSKELADRREAYKKLLIGVWAFTSYVLVLSYASLLTAMLALPTLPTRITGVEQLLAQDDIPWALRDQTPGVLNSWKAITRQSELYKRLHDEAIHVELTKMEHNKYGCLNTELYEGHKTAAICRFGELVTLISTDFGNTGKCHFYTTSERFLISQFKFAFQV